MSKSSVGEPPAIPTRSVPPRLAPAARSRMRAARAASLPRPPSSPPEPSSTAPVAPARTSSRRVRSVISIPPVVSGPDASRRQGRRGPSRGHQLPGSRLLDHRLVHLNLVLGLRPHFPADSAHPVSAATRGRERPRTAGTGGCRARKYQTLLCICQRNGRCGWPDPDRLVRRRGHLRDVDRRLLAHCERAAVRLGHTPVPALDAGVAGGAHHELAWAPCGTSFSCTSTTVAW